MAKYKQTREEASFGGGITTWERVVEVPALEDPPENAELVDDDEEAYDWRVVSKEKK